MTSVGPLSSLALFRLARNSIRSRSSVLDSFWARSPGMAEGPRLRSSIVSLGRVRGLPSAVIKRISLSSSPRRTPVWTLPSLGGQDDRLEPLGDLLVGVDDRLEQVGTSLTGADRRKLGADLAADRVARGLFDLVAANALDVRPWS